MNSPRQLQVYLENTWRSTYWTKYVGSTSLTVRTKAVLLQVCLKCTWNKYEKIILLQVCFKYTSRLLGQVCLVKYDASILQAYWVKYIFSIVCLKYTSSILGKVLLGQVCWKRTEFWAKYEISKLQAYYTKPCRRGLLFWKKPRER